MSSRPAVCRRRTAALGSARAGARRAVLAGCGLALLAAPAVAQAHAVLTGTSPRWNAVLKAAPSVLRLTYDEGVVGRYARVSVVTPAGRELAGPPRVDGRFVTVALSPGGRGSYTVRWRMVAADDGHVTEGAFSFGVQARPLAPAPTPGVGVPVVPELLAWLELVGVVLSGGVLTVRALVWPAGARAPAPDGRSPPREPCGAGVPVALWGAIGGAVVALHAGVLAFLVGVYPIVGGGLPGLASAEIIPIRVATHLGQAWTVTTFAWLGVLTLLVGAWVAPRRREPLLAVAGVAALATGFGISWASHPASRGTLALVADYVHLVAAALWLGGLLLLGLLTWAARGAPQPDREALACACLARFSALALPAVVALVAAGAFLAVRELPTASALVSTGYGRGLLLKSAVALAAVGFGAHHRRRLLPRIAGGAPVASGRWTLALEACLLLVALAIAAILSQSAPPA